MAKYNLETIVSRAKRKGFVYPNSEIYWGLANAWDFGPYGSLLKKNISDLWVKHFTQERDDVVFMDTAIIAHPTTWQASGHLASFSDALIDDKKTGKRFRADKIIEDFLEKEWKSFKPDKIIEDFLEKEWKRIRESDPNWSREIDEHHQESLEIIRKYHNQDWIGTVIGFSELNEVYKYLISIGETEEAEKVKKLRDSYQRIFDQQIKMRTGKELSEKICKLYSIPNLSPESWGNERMKAFIEKYIPNNPETWNPAEWTECRNFNLMLGTNLGPVADESSKVYLRPETCQSLFTDFKAVLDSTRNRIPFGLAQIGKAFRNEITPGQFLYRTREFEQMEIEYFVPADPDKAMAIYNQWKEDCMHYWTKIIGINPENLRFKDHDKLAHYAAAAVDVEYAYPRGFGEIQGIHNRTNFDLTQHQ